MDEITSALADCNSSKAPGYDGFNFKFVKEFWQDVGGEICKLILEFFETGQLPEENNHIGVTLIPKVDEAVEIKDFRPISMIGSIYKIILPKRLSKVMPELIGESHTTFVKDRQILDGALIANEVVWWIRKKKIKAAILKLDFKKAYDTVRWDFLDETLRGMGFGDEWTKWIMECVSTTSMSILVNGSPTCNLQMIPSYSHQLTGQLSTTTKNCSNVLRCCQGSRSIIESRCLYQLGVMMIGLRRQLP